MAGRFMDKETLEAEAERLQLDLTGLKWPQKQKAVLDAQRLEKEGKPITNGLQENLSKADTDGDAHLPKTAKEQVDAIVGFELDRISDKVAEDLKKNISILQGSEISDVIFQYGMDPDVKEQRLKELKLDAEKGTTPQDPVHVHVDVPYDPMDRMRGKSVMICPEMAPTPNQLFGYEEELDEEIVVEEVRHDVDSAYRAGMDLVTGTYTVKERTGRKVKAHTALPKQGCGIFFRPDTDRVPVVVSQGRRGYLWTHHRLPNIKQLLIESGYYEDYRHRFKDEPYVWHASGKILCCDIQLAEAVLRDIERKHAETRVIRDQNAEFIRKTMGS